MDLWGQQVVLAMAWFGAGRAGRAVCPHTDPFYMGQQSVLMVDRSCHNTEFPICTRYIRNVLSSMFYFLDRTDGPCQQA